MKKKILLVAGIVILIIVAFFVAKYQKSGLVNLVENNSTSIKDTDNSISLKTRDGKTNPIIKRAKQIG